MRRAADPITLRWFWSLTVNGPMTRSDRVATLEEAKAQFQKSWDAWKAWAKLEVPLALPADAETTCWTARANPSNSKKAKSPCSAIASRNTGMLKFW